VKVDITWTKAGELRKRQTHNETQHSRDSEAHHSWGWDVIATVDAQIVFDGVDLGAPDAVGHARAGVRARGRHRDQRVRCDRRGYSAKLRTRFLLYLGAGMLLVSCTGGGGAHRAPRRPQLPPRPCNDQDDGEPRRGGGSFDRPDEPRCGSACGKSFPVLWSVSVRPLSGAVDSNPLLVGAGGWKGHHEGPPVVAHRDDSLHL
jgi:hypothetical protein